MVSEETLEVPEQTGSITQPTEQKTSLPGCLFKKVLLPESQLQEKESAQAPIYYSLSSSNGQGLGQDETRSLELHPGAGTQSWGAVFYCFPRSTCRELNHQRSSRDLNSCS